MEKQKKQLRIGLAGLGNVGAGVYKNLDKNQFLLNERTGTELIVKKIAVRNPDRKRDVEVPSEILTTSWQDLVNDPEIDIIVELIGGVDEAFNLIAAALEANKVVVTGNKAVLAERGKELIEISEKQNTLKQNTIHGFRSVGAFKFGNIYIYSLTRHRPRLSGI